MCIYNGMCHCRRGGGRFRGPLALPRESKAIILFLMGCTNISTRRSTFSRLHTSYPRTGDSRPSDRGCRNLLSGSGGHRPRLAGTFRGWLAHAGIVVTPSHTATLGIAVGCVVHSQGLQRRSGVDGGHLSTGSWPRGTCTRRNDVYLTYLVPIRKCLFQYVAFVTSIRGR